MTIKVECVLKISGIIIINNNDLLRQTYLQNKTTLILLLKVDAYKPRKVVLFLCLERVW